jgi:hypothetical protein
MHSTFIVYPSDQFQYLLPLSALVFQAVTFLQVFTQILACIPLHSIAVKGKVTPKQAYVALRGLGS